MKKSIFVLFMMLLASNIMAETDSIKVGWGNLDYSVPESPAFSMLGNNPDNILKPTSVRSIAVNIGNFYLTKGNSLPKNFGVEISPLLLNPKVSLNSYNRHKFLYRMRISAGTNILDNGSYQIAEGLRFTIIDKTDLRSDSYFLDQLYQSCTNSSSATNKAIAEYIRSGNGKYHNIIDANLAYEKDTVFKKEIKELSKKYYTNNMINPDSINKIRSLRKEELWNATIWEVGIGSVQSSNDSLINNAKFSKASLWTTYGTHLSKKDQLLIGCKFSIVDSTSEWNKNFSIGTRYYYGSNNLRAFVQGEYKYEHKENGATASIGCIFNITNGIWGQFAMNFIFDNKGNVTYSPSLNVSLGSTEKKQY
ncbi:MAG: hypothetical protein P4L28_04950 [Paludibacteraceae bacterium]|nr:hypothetical protein [Paludibacteraceae bacterium]